MNILVLNAGSGSQRCSLFDVTQLPAAGEAREAAWEATIDTTAPGQPAGKLRVRVRRGPTVTDAEPIDRQLSIADRTAHLLRLAWAGPSAPLRTVGDIDVVGHRVVHGGDRFDHAVRIDATVISAIDALSAFAPLHNPVNLVGIRLAQELCAQRTVQVAAFDTAFHRTLPDAAAIYAGPYSWVEQGIRRYGFHGSNFRWLSQRAAHLLGRENDRHLRLILCHLGGGCSLCATRGGESIDTTMGFTPLDGIAMCTRSGALDPGILIRLQRQGKSADEIEHLLNKESGLKGLSGLSGDTRDLRPRIADGDFRANLAWNVFLHRLQAGIGQMLAALGDRPHAIVFSDAVAEDEPDLRSAACAPFAFLGLTFDAEKNRTAAPDCELTVAGSEVRALLIQSREAWQIARECHVLIGRTGLT